ncbi:FliM/FliN family flagellar motor switch protein [Vibrio agarivorans]|uniref:FliM/FliN family flagellar motor switch protein n=1 Tax=Vibrio agarivorans TaxID=153622 RepID=A0ABT7XVU1_9VIBR|nr:FliM/FliN family flagellar motor switch protein [Vibrio agarivorans]MDN2479888.1 FliM/FliN family flagellar motor switch protein [Vibrio agarivorans]
MKSNNKHIQKESEQLDVFNIDPRTLGRPLNIAKANLTPKLKSIEETLTMAINSMTRRCDSQVELKSIAVDMKPSVPLHTAPSFFSHSSHRGVCRLELSLHLLAQLAEAFYGGKPCFSAHASSNVTHLRLNASEKRVQTRLSSVVLNQIDANWSPLDNSPEFNTACLSVRFDIVIGELRGELSLQLDDELLIALGEPTKTTSYTSEEINDKRNHQLRQVPVKLNAVLAQQRMPLEQVAQLRVGDIITSDIKEIVEVSSGEQKLFLARISEQNNHLVLHITDHINQTENFSS